MKTTQAWSKNQFAKLLIKFCILIGATTALMGASAAFAQSAQDLAKSSQALEVNIANKKLTQLLTSGILAEYLLRVQDEGKMLDWPVVGPILKKFAIEPEKQRQIITKGIEAWTRYLSVLSEEQNYLALAGYTDFSFIEKSGFNSQEIEVLRNVFGFENGKIDSKRGITSAIGEFMLTEAISDPELRALEILNITQTTLLANGDFPLAAKSILELFKDLPYKNVRNKAEQVAFQLEHHRSLKRIQSLLSPEKLALGGFALRGLTIYSSLARAGLVSSIAYAQNLGLLGKATAASIAMHGLGFTAYSISKIKINSSEPSYELRNLDFIHSFLNEEKIDYLARKALSNPKIFSVSKLANAIFWGEVFATHDILILPEALSLSQEFNTQLKKIRNDELEVLNLGASSPISSLSSIQIASLASRLQSNFPKYNSEQKWTYRTLNVKDTETYQVANCVAKSLLALIYFDGLIEDNQNNNQRLKLETFSNHIRPIIITNEPSKYFDLSSNGVGSNLDLGTVLKANEIFDSWLRYRHLKSLKKDKNPFQNPFVKYLRHDPRIYPSLDTPSGVVVKNQVNDVATTIQIFSSKDSITQAQDNVRNQTLTSMSLPFTYLNIKPNEQADLSKTGFPFTSTYTSSNVVVDAGYPKIDSHNVLQHLKLQTERILSSKNWLSFVRDIKSGRVPEGNLDYLESVDKMIGSIQLICTFELPACATLKALEDSLQKIRDSYLGNMSENLALELSKLKDSSPNSLRKLKFELKFIFQTLMLTSGPTMRRMHAVTASSALQRINFQVVDQLTRDDKEVTNLDSSVRSNSNSPESENTIRITIELQPNAKLIPLDSPKKVDTSKTYDVKIDRRVLALLWTNIYNVIYLDIDEMSSALFGEGRYSLKYKAEEVDKITQHLLSIAQTNVEKCLSSNRLEQLNCNLQRKIWMDQLLNTWSAKKTNVLASIAVYGLPPADIASLQHMSTNELQIKDWFSESTESYLYPLRVIEFDLKRQRNFNANALRKAQLKFLSSMSEF